MTSFLTSVWGIGYLAVAVTYSAVVGRELYFGIDLTPSWRPNVAKDAFLRTITFFLVTFGAILAATIWPITMTVYAINRVAARRSADYNAMLDRQEW